MPFSTAINNLATNAFDPAKYGKVEKRGFFVFNEKDFDSGAEEAEVVRGRVSNDADPSLFDIIKSENKYSWLCRMSRDCKAQFRTCNYSELIRGNLRFVKTAQFRLNDSNRLLGGGK